MGTIIGVKSSTKKMITLVIRLVTGLGIATAIPNPTELPIRAVSSATGNTHQCGANATP